MARACCWPPSPTGSPFSPRSPSSTPWPGFGLPSIRRQRRLIDRFHRVIVAKIAELAPTTFLDAGCGEGFVADTLLRQLPGLEITGFDFNPAAVGVAARKVPNATFQTASIF